MQRESDRNGNYRNNYIRMSWPIFKVFVLTVK